MGDNVSKKNNDWLVLGLLVVGGYFLLKSGVLDNFLNYFGAGSGNGGGGGNGGVSSLTPSQTTPPLTPSLAPPAYQSQKITIGLLAPKPIINTVQPYGFVGVDKNNQYIQRATPLTTTPAMANPAIVQARGIISQTANIDVGAIINTIRTTRKTYSSPAKVSNIVAPAKLLVQKTSGINVNNLIQILKTKPDPVVNVTPAFKTVAPMPKNVMISKITGGRL